MKRFLVHENERNGPATHAMIIGVGQYPHLVGGSGPLSRFNDGMGQLSSPPLSVRAFSDWLISTYNNPGKPLATVAMLVSDANDQGYTPPGGGPVALERATLPNAEAAINEWIDRGETNPDHLLIFYFCGHGALAGTEASLLLEDYGADDRKPLRGAVDFRQFHLGMDKCAARYQVYFIDACRVATSAVLDAQNYSGDPIIYGSIRPPVNQAPRHAPVFYSTLSGALAHSRPNEASFFSESLIRAFHGAADNPDADAKWRVNTTNLHQGIDALLKHAGRLGLPTQQTNLTDHLSEFLLHELTGEPLVPVFVGCKPEDHNPRAELSYSVAAVQTTVGPGQPWGWDLSLHPGTYTFVATSLVDPSSKGEAQREIRPVCREIQVEVQS
jgi:hypothetical protein